jgi:hypothetical protein
MSKNKIVAALVHFINFGISSDSYYSCGEGKEHLKTAKAFWDDQHRLCFTMKGKTYKFAFECVEEAT